MLYVYILRQANGEFYVGSTKNLRKRLEKHQNGEVPHTSKHRPLKLVWCAVFENNKKATAFEDYLKTGSGKAFRDKRLI